MSIETPKVSHQPTKSSSHIPCGVIDITVLGSYILLQSRVIIWLGNFMGKAIMLLSLVVIDTLLMKMLLTVCYYPVTYEPQRESTLYSLSLFEAGVISEV